MCLPIQRKLVQSNYRHRSKKVTLLVESKAWKSKASLRNCCQDLRWWIRATTIAWKLRAQDSLKTKKTTPISWKIHRAVSSISTTMTSILQMNWSAQDNQTIRMVELWRRSKDRCYHCHHTCWARASKAKRMNQSATLRANEVWKELDKTSFSKVKIKSTVRKASWSNLSI